ncbi:MAG: hypothetical protein JSS71_09295 [Armatimonadetes bacterium]|nr:hypothetical protein [Armatimonadota bacterium]MBX3109540.1 hypothetical protein [Fimbriimonadaceae bacterium]
MPLTALLLAALARPVPIQVDYAAFRGLQMKVGGVTVIEGSGFQYYEKGWKKGYFSSAWKPVNVYPHGNGAFTVIANSDDGQVGCRQTITPTESGFKVTADFNWHNASPAKIEYTIGRLWAPYFDQGELMLDGVPANRLDTAISAGATFEQRLYGSAKSAVFRAPAAKVTVKSNVPLSVMDARNYSIDWADGKELFWLGFTDQDVTSQQGAHFEYEVSVEPEPWADHSAETVTLPLEPLDRAQGPEAVDLPILPNPKQMTKLSGSTRIDGGLEFQLPKGLESEADWFDRFLSGRWAWERSGPPTRVEIRIQPGVAKENGYRLQIDSTGAVLTGQSLEGLRYGIRTLAQLVRAQSGHMELPWVDIVDYPSAQWRGVHLFVGPQAVSFQGKLADRILAPFKLNKVVLQCERTVWDALPGIETNITMKKSDLGKLAENYRALGFEPIPLVQSLGHMEWFFANQKNTSLAVNPKIPYTLDVRKAEARDRISQVWDEVTDVVNPQVGHFGLDEIDMRGIDDPDLTNRLWEKGLPLLQGIARKHGFTPMVWSDMLLAEGEAVDACHAPSLAAAKARRSALERGTYVADWHYRDNPQPAVFDKSLELWNSLGMKPVAATWFRPGNIRGFVLSAIKNRAGILQTTWAGYSSDEANMVREFDQFSAMVMMADYAWSGRQEMPDKLGYDPDVVFQRLYFGERQTVRTRPGLALAGERPGLTQIGPYWLRTFAPRQLYGVTSPAAAGAPHEIQLPVGREAEEAVVALDCLATLDAMAPAGQLVFEFTDGTKTTEVLWYGADVRSVTDKRATLSCPRTGSVSAVAVQLHGKTLKSLTVVATNPAGGLRLHGVTLL